MLIYMHHLPQMLGLRSVPCFIQGSHFPSFFSSFCAVKVVGVEEERVGTMVGILAGILHIGNVALQGDEET
jgi:hypothetical protein